MEKLFEHSIRNYKFRIVEYGDLWLIERSYKRWTGFLWWKKYTWCKWHGVKLFPTYNTAYKWIVNKF